VSFDNGFAAEFLQPAVVSQEDARRYSSGQCEKRFQNLRHLRAGSGLEAASYWDRGRLARLLVPRQPLSEQSHRQRGVLAQTIVHTLAPPALEITRPDWRLAMDRQFPFCSRGAFSECRLPLPT